MLDKSIEEIIIVNKYLLSHKQSIAKDIGATIKNIRNEKNISIEDFSKMILTSSSYVSQIEQGINGLSLAKFILICNALGIMSREILEDFIFYEEANEDILYNQLQIDKNISKNVINYMKKKR